MSEHHLLVVDDEADIQEPIRRFFERKGYVVSTADSIAAAVDLFRERPPDVAILDYSLPDGDGLDLLRRLRHLDPALPCVILTAHGSIDLAVRAIKEGAEQFFTKPVELAAVAVVLDRLIETRRLRHLDEAGRKRQARGAVDPFTGTSPAIRRLAAQAAKVATSAVPVLILGETGTGKGVLARWLHDHGPRADEAFVDQNCAGLSKDLLESELFGHQKGAFTGAVAAKPGLLETAHRGTLFLDEIGEMDLQVQGKLLKVLEDLRFRRLGEVQDRRVDLRLVAATHRDLERRVEEGAFREDLYYRINIVPLHIPPLRDRTGDLVPLARELVTQVGAEMGRPGASLSGGAEAALGSHHWPGNVRELRNVLERAVLLSAKDLLEADDLGDSLAAVARRRPSADAAAPPAEAARTEGVSLADIERRHIETILREQEYRVPEAARLLGIPRSSLYERIRKYQIPLSRSRK